MRKVSGIFLVGLCLGAIGAVVVTARQGAAVDSPRPIASTESVTTMSTPTPTPAPTPTVAKESSTPSSAPKPRTDLSALDALVPGGEVSAVVLDRTSGKTLLASHPDRVYTSASLVKLFIALEVLDRGGPADDVRRMLSRSDDDLASRFWSGYGGPRIVERWARTMGLHATKPPADPGRWGDTEITASDMVRVYRYLADQGRTTILNALRDATERGSDGFRQYFGIPDGATGRSWAIKQGWACCRPDRVLHSTGLVGDDRYVVVVLTEHPRSVSDATGSQRVTSVVKSLLSQLGI